MFKMTEIILCGASGKMGKAVTDCAENTENCEIIAGIDAVGSNRGYEIFKDFKELGKSGKKGSVIIDFSRPEMLDGMLEYAAQNSVPVVIATTGFSERQIQKIHDASKKVPIFFSFNMSLGINLLSALVKKAACALGESFDIEIVEMHHNQKVDAPSGTALMLADEINHTLSDSMVYEYDRHSKRAKRKKNEIGIHSVRGGTIVGEHEVIFAGNDEVITLKHEAYSKNVFAVGALNAARFIDGAQPGLYDMSNIID